MDRQENNDDTREVDMDLELSDDDDDDSWPVFHSMQQWAYTVISFLELYGIDANLYETMSGLVALTIILFQATNTNIQRENQYNLDSNSNDEVSEENK